MIDLPSSLARLLAVGPLLLLLGASTSLGGHGVFPGLVATVGFVTTAFGVHRLGRLGPARLRTLGLTPKDDDRDVVESTRSERG